MSDYARRTRARPRTEQRRHLSAIVEGETLGDAAGDDERPRTRAECVDGPRPCGFVSCRHHLALEVDPANGSIKLNHPDAEPWGVADTCSLDVADRGETTTAEIGRLLNLSRARVDQVITIALRVLGKRAQLRRG